MCRRPEADSQRIRCADDGVNYEHAKPSGRSGRCAFALDGSKTVLVLATQQYGGSLHLDLA